MSKFQSFRIVVLHVLWVALLTAAAYAQPYQDAMFLNKEMRAGTAAGGAGPKVQVIAGVMAVLFLALYVYKIRKSSGKNA